MTLPLQRSTQGNRERRPDIVLYINGIAVGVLELKNSQVSIGDGIRQNISIRDQNSMNGSSVLCSSFLQVTTPKG
ncbi:MAG: type I restriction endonuclease [Methanolobus sp.]